MNDLTEQAGTEVANVGLDAFGKSPISQQDVTVPSVMCMQGLSKLVIDGKARFGDFVDSLSSEVIGNIEDSPLEFIPFHLEKMWIISQKDDNGKFQFERMEAVSIENENKKWTEVIDGKEYKNEKSFNFYSILPADPSIPYLIKFKSTSLKAGRELATQMYVKNRAAGKVPPAKVMSLKGDKATNDHGTFVVLKTSTHRNSTQEEITNCLDWYKMIVSGECKVDEGAEADTTVAPSF